MTRRYFGTDGIRGQVGTAPMTVDFALRLASAAARVLAPQGGTVLIGKDTRVSGYMFESALEAGFVASGVDVLLTGPLPTPAIAMLTKKLGADFGIVISASHNPYHDNGIKFFDAEGEKLSDDVEERHRGRARLAARDARIARARPSEERLGGARATTWSSASPRFPTGMGFEDFKIVVDASHGAAYKVAPRVMSDLGADVVPVGCSPNGRNINDGCGSTRPDLLKLTVTGVRAHVGFALDGDGDRVVMVDERGNLVDGDQLVYHPGARSLRVADAARARRRHRHEQPRARARAARLGRRVPARQGRRPPRARDAEGARAASSAARPRGTSFASIGRRPATV